MTRIVLVLVAFCGLGWAQHKPKSTPAPVPVVSSVPADDVAYPLPLAERDQIRDLQHTNDQIEIEIQKLLVKIAEYRGRQDMLVEGMKLTALQFAQAKHINLDRYKLDPGPIQFVKKEASKP